MIDPRHLLERAAGVTGPGDRPIPLRGERIEVTIRSGLALVSREQIFRNDEAASIEATLTFPVPVHATLHRLTARIGDRLLTARALPRGAATARYEAAIDAGRTAVLHEELIRGVHMLQVAHIPPGAEIAVTHGWIMALSPGEDGLWRLRIPVTMGDIYGDTPFGDAEDLAVSGRVVHEAALEVEAAGAAVTVAGRLLAGTGTRLRLDAPIDLGIGGMAEGPAWGVAADGSAVSVLVTPDLAGDGPIDAAILVDRSGSMAGAAGSGSGISKRDAVARGLAEAAAALRRTDRVALWQFDGRAERLSDGGTPLRDAIWLIREPGGGTEIGSALGAVIGGSAARDILLVTDGLSHALDVQALANTGRRFTVVLIGADAFEANVGRLAALTGGQLLIARDGADAAQAVRRAIRSLRRSRPAFATCAWPLDRVVVEVGGALVTARWEALASPVEGAFAEAVGALAAAMALPHLPADEAREVAAAHGIVCHLTSLVLVDQTGAVQDGLPAQRKVPLMAASCRAVPPAGAGEELSFDAMGLHSPAMSRMRMLEEAPPYRRTPRLAEAARAIDWGADPAALSRGELAALPPWIAAAVTAASSHPAIMLLAEELVRRGPQLRRRTAPEHLARAVVIALLAHAAGEANRAASRVARAVLDGLDPAAIEAALTALGLAEAQLP